MQKKEVSAMQVDDFYDGLTDSERAVHAARYETEAARALSRDEVAALITHAYAQMAADPTHRQESAANRERLRQHGRDRTRDE